MRPHSFLDPRPDLVRSSRGAPRWLVEREVLARVVGALGPTQAAVERDDGSRADSTVGWLQSRTAQLGLDRGALAVVVAVDELLLSSLRPLPSAATYLVQGHDDGLLIAHVDDKGVATRRPRGLRSLSM
ncbi:hypothetical protein ACMHYB_44075 [Sorangium sp. So ce1128]